MIKGEYSVSGSEKVLGQVRSLCNVPVLQNVIELNRLCDRCYRIYERSKEDVFNILNEIHGIRESHRYWHTVLGLDVFDLFSTVYSRYLYLSGAFSVNDGLVVPNILPDSYITPYTLDGLWKIAAEDDVFNIQLYSQASALLNVGKSHTCELLFSEELIEVEKDGATLKDFIRSLFDYRNFGLRSAIACYGLRIPSRKEKFKLALFSAGKAWPVTSIPGRSLRRLGFTQERDRKSRARFSSLTGDDEIATLCLRTLQYNLPRIYIEDFDRVRSETQETIKQHGLPSVIACGTLTPDYKARFWVAECMREGATIVGVQHGSLYGDTIFTVWEQYERAYSDFYLTWGWEEHEKDRPAPAPRLLGFANAKLNTDRLARSKGLLWVTTTSMSTREFSYPLPPRHELLADSTRYDKVGRVFCDTLAPEIREETCIRFKPGDNWTRKQLLEQFPDLTVDSHGLLQEQAKDYALAVIDHFPSTSFYELMALGIPTIVLDPKARTMMRTREDRCLQRLIDVGIIHTCPETAAKTINKIYGAADEWWRESERAAAIDSVASIFARSSPTGSRELSSFLTSVA